MLTKWLAKIKDLERKQMVIIGLAAAMIFIGAIAIEGFGEGGKFGDDDDERHGKSKFENAAGDQFGDEGIEGAKENPVVAVIQLGGVVIGTLLLGVMIKPKDMSVFEHVVLGKSKSKDVIDGGIDEE